MRIASSLILLVAWEVGCCKAGLVMVMERYERYHTSFVDFALRFDINDGWSRS